MPRRPAHGRTVPGTGWIGQSYASLSSKPEEAHMHRPIPTPNLAAFLALMGLFAAAATVAYG